jgi:hypothetical protein
MKEILNWVAFFLLLPGYIIGRVLYLLATWFDEWLQDYLEGDPYL